MMLSREKSHFSELLEHNSKLLALWSPCGQAFASAVQSQLQIWDIKSKEISHRFECDYPIDFIKWSPNSELICSGTLKECIQIWNLKLPHWRCKISGCLGFVDVLWAPDCQHLLVISEFHIKISIFSTVSSTVGEIDCVKAIDNGIIFSSCDKYLVIAQRVNFEDSLGVYSCETWEMIKTFAVDTKDLATISFCPTNLLIAVLESAIECKLLFYSIDGRLLGKYVSESNFGFISMSWNITKNALTVGDCYGEVKVFDCIDYEVVSLYQHPDVIESKDILVYKITESSEINSPGNFFSAVFEHDEVVSTRPVSLMSTIFDSEKGKRKNPLKSGVSMLQFSSNGKYIASVNGNMPKYVFIYDVENSKFCSVIMRGSSIKSICWHPKQSYLVICSSCNVFDLWTPEFCIRYLVPFTNDFSVSHAAWNSTGEYILLNSRDKFSVVFFHGS